MAYIVNRGTKAEPNLHGRYSDADGTWRTIKVPEEHAASKRDAQKWIDAKQEDIDKGRPDPSHAPTFAELMPLWLASLTNRNAKGDSFVTNKHVLPAFRHKRPTQVEHTDLVRWLDQLRSGKKPLSGSSQRACLNLLSRFYGWAIARGYAKMNPVRMIPRGERPKQRPKDQNAPWVRDDAQVLEIAGALPSPLGLMYLIGNRCGLRPGEVSGLRVSDLAELEDGRLRVRFSEDGPLKEDKGDGPTPKVKWAPAPEDVQLFLASWLARWDAEQLKARAEAFVFEAPGGSFFTKMQRSRAWRALPEELRGTMTWYEASRHSFASRNLEAGARLEEVSGALGHSTPAVTLRHYARFVRKDYSETLRRGLRLTDAKVLTFPPRASAR